MLVGGFFSELNVLVRAEGLAGVGALGRQEVNDACFVSLMNGNCVWLRRAAGAGFYGVARLCFSLLRGGR